MINLDHITAPLNCTGCGLCANICPKNAIRMIWSKEGFLIPDVDLSSCVNCGICVKKCIALEDKPIYTDDINNVISYGGWNKDENTHLKSSSGGIFSAIAENIISQGGVVFGVVWKDKQTAFFEKAETIESLAKMRGSKYTPALTGNIYKKVLTELKKGRQVLFSSIPCQVHALKKYLNNIDYQNLFTIDIMCHGMPSHLIIKQYIQEDETISKKFIKYISFRDNSKGWNNYQITKYYTDGTCSSTPMQSDIYMKMFLCDKALNYVCYNCPYAHIPRQGDITLGDYWGVQNYHPDWPIDKGISAILANNQKGLTMLETLSNQLTLHKESFSKIYNGQKVVYIKPEKQVPKDRSEILCKIQTTSLNHVYKKYIQTVRFGFIRLNRNGIIYKTYHLARRCLRALKRRIFNKL